MKGKPRKTFFVRSWYTDNKMNKGSSFEKLRLSNDAVKKIKNTLPSKDFNFNPSWLLIGGKSWYEENKSDPSDVLKLVQNDFESNDVPKETLHESQFFFTQAARPIYKENIKIDSALSVECMIESSIESLEHSNGRHDFQSFKILSNVEISKVFEALSKKLSENGVSNLCYSVCNMTTEQSLTFLPTLCTQFLLPKIIGLERDSVLIKKGICDWTNKFPDETRNLVFSGILNSDPKNTGIIIALLKAFGIQKYSSLLSDFVNHTRELKQWHFSILEMLSSVKLDENSRKKLLKLYLNKAMTFSKDKGYAKLIQTFAKTNAPFSGEEKLILEEIAALNQTVYKKLIQKYSKI